MGGARAPLTPHFEAPDYILRPKLRIFQTDQSCPPPWPNLGSVADNCKNLNHECWILEFTQFLYAKEYGNGFLRK